MEENRLDLVSSIKRFLRENLSQGQGERNITFLFLDTAVQGILAGGILAFMPVFIVRLGGSSLLVSLLTALPALGIVLFSIPAAQFVVRQQNMVRVTVIYRLCYHSLFLVIALVPFFLRGAGLPVVLVILWALQAFPTAVSTVSWTEVVAHAVPMDRLAKINGARWAVFSVVSAAAVAFFGLLLERIALPLNYQIVFLCSVGSGYVSTFFFSRIRVPDSFRPRVPRQDVSLPQRLRELVTPLTDSKPFRLYLTATFLIRIGMSLPAALYSIYWVNHLYSTDGLIGWRTMAANLALVAGYTFWGRMVSRMGNVRALVICGLGIALYPALTAFVGMPAWLIPVALVWGFFVSGIDITIFDGLLRISPPMNRTAYVGMNTVVANLAVSAGPVLGALVSSLVGIGPAFFLAMLIGILGAALVWRWQVGVSPS